MEVGAFVYEHFDEMSGVSFLPYDLGTYVQAPFEDITKEKYEELLTYLTDIDLSEVKEEEDNTDLSGEIACGGGKCEI